MPQESILVALLLIIYVNDLAKTLQKCEVVLYADDTLTFTDDKNDNLSKGLKWLNIKERLQVNTIYFIRNIKIDDASDYRIDQLRYIGEVQPYSLGNVMDFRIQ